MQKEAPRYAIYFAPDPASPLWRFGCDCLGYDASSGYTCDQFVPRGLDENLWYDLTEAPRPYGFHATLKAPFYLNTEFSEDDLIESVYTFAGRQPTFSIPALAVGRLSDFLALLPPSNHDLLQALSARIVEVFDRFRAPLSAEDIARRNKSPLSERQKSYLDLWGYPYVFDEFRFHMTLTGALPEALLDVAQDEMVEFFSRTVGPVPIAIDSIVLARQEYRNGRFRIIERGQFSTPRIS